MAMPPSKSRRKGKVKRKKTRFKSITFKLTENQYRSLRNYCKARKTTPIKLIKKNIERYTSNYTYQVPHTFYVTENQLELFQEE